ncbi:MAG: hypothetical protein KJZ84_18545 [Bryobacteraceae bacterium]|nr:hypothetical protein [Bryobacteraceae bacterium]
MPEYLGPIAIPEAAPAGVFPLVPEFGMVFASEPEIAVHRFGHGETQVEQRFWLGPGARRITLRFDALNAARRQALVNFFQLRQGSYQPFFFDVAMPDGTTVRHTVRFAEPSLSLDQFSESLWRGTVDLVEAPQDTPSVTVTQTLTRFPSAELASTLLGQMQELIPLVTIGSDIHLSDRRVSVGGVLYQPRLVDWDGISQALDGSADSARFRLGNADRVLTELVNAVDLWKQPVAFSLFHVGSATRIDLWKGFVTRWSLDQAGAFEIEASDGLFELNLPYPSRKITRDEVKIPDQPVNVGGKKGISRMTATSVVNDTAYGRALKDIYVNDAAHPIPVECEIVAGRDESEFYAALGIVGRGPISGFATSTAQPHTLDGQPNHGPGLLGLRRSYGGNPVTGDETPADNAPDSGSHTFALDSVGEPLPNNPVPGVAFLQIRRTDEKGIQPIRPTERKMQAQITGGLGCWAWTAPATRLWLPACTNPVWIAVNTLLRAKGLSSASAAAQEALFDVPAAISAAQTCDILADRIIGTGQEQQFRFTGVLAEERPLRDWLQEILGSCLGYFTFVAGKLRIGLRIHSSVVEAFTTGNILYNSLSLGSLEPRFNDLTAAFADVDYGYQQNALNLYDADHAARVGERLKANVNLVGVSTKSQAARLITTRLREELGGLTAAEQLAARQISFRTTVLALNTEPGMVCSMTHPDMPNGAGEFRLIRWRLNRDYSIDLEGRSTTDSMYDLTVGDKPTDVVPEPVPQSPAADLFPGKVTGIELVGTVQFDGLTAEAILRYLPPEPLAVFRGVVAFARMPQDSGEVPLEKGSARFEPDSEGRGTIRVSFTQPAGADRECRIWLCSRSAILTAPLDEVATPSIVVTIPAATPVGDIPLADIALLAASQEIKDGRVLIHLTGTAPVDENFAGAEVFLEIPQEADTDPEHPTLPGQFYRQNWHFGEPSIEGTPRQWEAKLDVPVPPTEYLQSLASPTITWLAYALPRSWGYTNRLKRLTSLDPVAPAEHTPFVQVTLDFTDYLAGVVSDELGSVTLVGDPVVGQDSTGIQVTQSYVPPYYGVPGAFSIGEFEGVEAVIELADGTVLDRGKHPYTAQWDSPGNNVDAVRVAVPKPATLPATLYLHMMAYSPANRQKFKKVVHDGVPTVHAQYAIATVTISVQSLELTPPTIASVIPAYRAIPGSAAKEFRLDITLSGVSSGGAYGGTLFDLQDVATGSWSFSFQEHVAGQPHAPVEAGDWWKIAPGESRSYKVKGWAYSAADPNSRIATNEITVQVSLPLDEVIPPVSSGTFSLAIDGYTNGEDGEPFANLRVNFTIPSGADVVTAHICEKPHGHTPTPNLTEFTSLTSSTGTTFQSWRRRPKDGARVFVCLTAANQAAGVWRPVDASAPIKWVDIAPWGSPGPVTSPSVSIQNQRTLDGAAYVDIAVNFTPPASPDYWYTKVGRIWRLNASFDPVPGETYEKNGDFGERASFVIEKVKLQNEPQYQTWRFRPVDWRGNVVEADTVTVNFTLPASTGLDLAQVNPATVRGFEIVNGKFQPKLGPDFIVDAQGNLTQFAVDLAKAHNFGPEFTKDGGVLAMQGMAVNKLLAGTALFSGDVVFARDSGGSLAINGDGIVAARGGNQIAIGATSVTISGGGQALTISSQGIVGNVGTFNSLVTLQEFHAWNGGTPLFSVNHNGINCGGVLKANAGISVSGTVTGLVRSVNGLQGDVTVSGGEQGPPGPQGPQGPAGPQGAQGPAGPVSSAWDCPYTGWGNSTVATALDNILQRLNQAGI